MNFQSAMDIVFPRICAGCGNMAGAEARYLCWDCFARISVIRSPFCHCCGCPCEGTVESRFICSTCKRQRPFFDAARSAAHYTGIPKKLVQDFKYHGAIWLACDIAALMTACFKAHLRDFQADLVAPVPLYPVRQRERTYNQAGLLAKRVSKALRKPLDIKTLYRTRQTKSQTHLTAAERKANVRNAFGVRKETACNGLNVLVVDDVMTTGATLSDCARALKAAGALAVAALTAARG